MHTYIPDVPLELLKGKDYDLIHMRIRAYLKSFVKPWSTGTYGLLSVGKDTKTVKGEKYGVRTGVLYLAPADLSGTEICPRRTKGCSIGCLFTSGHGTYWNVREARLRKTMVLNYQRELFDQQLNKDIVKLDNLSEKAGLLPAVRLNGTSDVDWINHPFMGYDNIFESFPNINFYDYTKRIEILKAHSNLRLPNYHLTFSRSETINNQLDVEEARAMKYNVTVVFHKELPPMWQGVPVVDGDRHDIRFWDKLESNGRSVIIGLIAKGKARYDTTGFVVD